LACYATLRSVLPNLDRVNQIMSAPTGSSLATRTARLRTGPSTIQLRDVSFAYGTLPPLQSISATFHRGETIGIVGPSGAGKWTLMALLLGFYEPAQGAVLYDDLDERLIVRADLMDRCAIVLQEPFLFGASLADNIRAGRPDATMADII